MEELDSTDILYSYNGDRLLSYGEESFDYDELGNPITYRGKACEWEKGRQLVSYNGNTFTYDGQGRRISKNTTQYTYDSNGNLIKQSNGENTLEFVYDNKGVVGVTHITNNRTQKYFFRRNAQGDVIALLDNKGSVVVKYVYDAWGNHKAYDENGSEITSVAHIGNLNPFRYRGYYYDAETKLYFLKTRYYDPEVGRFMTIDGIEYLDPESINGLNLYAYCGNNPVMCVDPNGTSWSSFWKGVGNFFIKVGKVIAGAVMAVVGAVITLASFVNLSLGGGFVTQFGFSLSMYGGFMLASAFSDSINADMEAIGWNPFNANESKVLNSSAVSFYKGVPVFMTNMSRSGTFLGIFLRRNNAGADELRHEWGHTIQQGIVGSVRFLLTYAITSSAGLSNRSYYNRPWEITADIFGGVNTKGSRKEKVRGWGYLATVMFGFPFSYLFLIGEY